MFASLSDKLSGIFDKLTRRGILTEEMVDETMREIKIALLEADVALPVVKDFITSMRQKAIGEKIIKSISPAQMIVKLVHDELISLLGTPRPLQLPTFKQNIILMLGLQGSGKTTTAAKLGLKLKKEGKKVLLASLDIYRPAAREQLADLGAQNNIEVLPIVPDEKPIEIARRAQQEASRGLYDVLILDTAGRLHIDEPLIQEAIEIKKYVQPVETILVVDAMTGQDAVRAATAFNEQVGITGTILTRIDGDARGGAALSMKQVTGAPILYLGAGEKINALETFDAKRIAGRILGMGDIVGLVETTIEKINKDEAEKSAQRMLSGNFNLNDLLDQMRQINKLGDIKGIIQMIPGLSKFQNQINQAGIDNRLIKRQEAIILSMTPFERRNPDVLKAARKQRIAAGAGVSVSDVNRLLKQYEQMAQVMKKMKKMGPLGMMSMMKKMGSITGMAPESFMGNGLNGPFGQN